MSTSDINPGECVKDVLFTEDTLEVLYAFTCRVNMVDAPPPYQPVSRSFLPLIMSAP